MVSAQQQTQQMFDHFYVEQKKLETDVNSIPRTQALSDLSCYSSLSELANCQAMELSDLVDRGNRQEIAAILHEHPLHREMILQSAVARHALGKPRGYAGDMDLMLMICEQADSGDTNYAVLQNRVYLDLPAAEAVRQRARSLYETLRQLPDGSRVLNLACGPALEVQHFVEHCGGRGIKFYLVDHDLNTVRYVSRSLGDEGVLCAIGNAFQVMKGNYQVAVPRGSLVALCDPRKDFEGWRALLAPFKYNVTTLRQGEFDLVYSSGLFDYIRSTPGDNNRGAAGLTKRLFDLVKPGGSLIIGNYLAPAHSNPHKKHHRTIMELYCEWNLIYRSPDEIRGLMAGVPAGDYSMELVDEYFGARQPSSKGAIGFLVVTKHRR